MATRQRTLIAFARHEEHKDNILTLDGIGRATKRGKALGRTSVIQAAYSSPLPRAKTTAECMLEGADINLSIMEEPRLGDFKTDPRAGDKLDLLKAAAKAKFGNTDDASLAGCLLDMPELHPLMLMRAEEGAEALTEIAINNAGKFVLATSHGVARMEVAMQWLKGHRYAPEALDITDKLVDRGEAVLLVFDIEHGQATFVEAKPLKLLD